MTLSALAGKKAPRNILANIPKLVTAYFAIEPDPNLKSQRVSFGTSGHRGCSTLGSFNEHHILAITQAICQYRAAEGIDGPLFLGVDTHALSEPAQATALEVLAANGVDVMVDAQGGYTPTPVISQAILSYNQKRDEHLADGVVITPSHNPPQDGGFKYNPPHGGPAGSEQTGHIEKLANQILQDGCRSVKRVPYAKARAATTTHHYDYVTPYIAALSQAINMEAISAARLKIGVDPLGGAGIGYWAPIAERYKLDIDVVCDAVDPTFSFMTVDWDGKIRMDCSSPYAMAGLIALKDRYDIAFGNDPDYDRHGIVTRSSGLLNPNHYLAVAIDYLFRNRPGWKSTAAVGKTLVSSSILDRVARALGRNVVEVPVGFKWFVDGLLEGNLGFGGEESAGASFLRRNGEVWTTDKDGILLALLAAEIVAKTQKDPGLLYSELTRIHGAPVYARIDAPASPDQKSRLAQLSPDKITATELAGEPIQQALTHAPGNGASIGGLKVVTEQGWFAARPSGTENVYKIYAESFRGPDHLKRIQQEAQELVTSVLGS